MVFIRVFQTVLRKRIARWVHIQQKHETVMTKVSIKTDRKDNLSFFKKQKILEAKATNKIHRIITKKTKILEAKVIQKKHYLNATFHSYSNSLPQIMLEHSLVSIFKYI